MIRPKADEAGYRTAMTAGVVRLRFLLFLLLAIVICGVATWTMRPRADSQPPQKAAPQPALADDIPDIGLAAYDGRSVELRQLISRGINIEATGRDQRSPLLLAAAAGHTETAQTLIAAGARVDTADSTGMTALHWAAVGGHAEVAKLLLRRSPPVDAADETGSTPLILAAMHGRDAFVQLLLEAGAERDTRDRDGNSAYDWAERNQQEGILLLLSRHRE